MSVTATAPRSTKGWGWGWFALALLGMAGIYAFVVQKQDYADDAYFSTVLAQQDLWDYLAFRYQRWTSRLWIELALVTLVNHMAVVRILDTLMLGLLCAGIGRLGFGARLRWPAATAAAFAVFMLANPSVLDNGAWWVTGSFNYLWPAALGIVSLLPFVERRQWPVAARVAFALAGGLAVYNEQVALLLVLLLGPLAWHLHRGRTLDRRDVAHLAFLLANLAVVVAAPGARNRYLEEQAHWFPNFHALDVIDKANIGLGLASHAVVHAQNLLALLLVALAAWFLPTRAVGRGTRLALGAGLAFVAATFVFAMVLPETRLQLPYAVIGISGANAAWTKGYAVMALFALSVACLVGALVLVFQDAPRTAAAVGAALLAGLATVAALGWSPTAFDSGARIQFVLMVVLATVACRVLAALEDAEGVRARRAALVVVGSIAAARVLHLVVHALG
jgi:hypothetical protein